MSHLYSKLLICLFCFMSSVCLANDGAAGKLLIHQAYSLATPPTASVAVGYLKITNNGAGAQSLLGASSPVAEEVQIHESLVSDGVAKMRRLEGGLRIAPGETLILEPGSYHLMFMKLEQPFKVGQQIPVTFDFGEFGEVTIEMEVQKLGMASGHGGHKSGKKTMKHNH